MSWTINIEDMLSRTLAQARIQEKISTGYETRIARCMSTVNFLVAAVALVISVEVWVTPEISSIIATVGGLLIAGLVAFNRAFLCPAKHREAQTIRIGCLILINKISMQLALDREHRQESISFTQSVIQDIERIKLIIPEII